MLHTRLFAAISLFTLLVVVTGSTTTPYWEVAS
jgi:hypothetical protein